MAELPPGYVDPRDVAAVTGVLEAVLAGAGPAGVLDLLAHVPGVRTEPGAARGFLRAAVPRSAWVGTEHQLVLTQDGVGGAALADHHVVGGVTLHREVLTRDRAPAVVAAMLADAVAAVGSDRDASAALTAHRDLYAP